MKTTTKVKGSPITEVARLYGRCLRISIGQWTVEVKVMGDKVIAAEQRQVLIDSLTAMGVLELSDIDPSKGDK